MVAAGGGVERMVRLAKSMMIALWSYHLNNIIFTLAVFLPLPFLHIPSLHVNRKVNLLCTSNKIARSNSIPVRINECGVFHAI